MTEDDFVQLVADRMSTALHGTVDLLTLWVSAPLPEVVSAVLDVLERHGRPTPATPDREVRP